MAGYDFAAIEKKWQDYWEAHGSFRQPNPGEKGFVHRPKKYVLDMFPYPSGAGLHVGHPEGYTATDIVARYFRMKGCNVLHPMGYDSFGLPAEQYAVEHGVHPRETTAANIANIERQIRMFGFSYDWSRRVATTDTDYYRWTQWIFLKLYNSWYDEQANAARPIKELIDGLESGKLLVDFAGNIQPSAFMNRIPEINLTYADVGQIKFYELPDEQKRELIDSQRLAYQAEVPVNWCPMLGTVLANEEVTNDGRSDRGNYPVYRRAMRQWMLRITAYAERLLEDLDGLDWPEPIKIMQRNWIGRSEGANLKFPVCSIGVSPVLRGKATSVFAEYAATKRIPPLSAESFQAKNPYEDNAPPRDDVMEHIRNLPHREVEGATYFVTFSAQPGEQLTPEERSLVLEACLHWHRKSCTVFAAVIMDDHAHLLVRPHQDMPLSQLMHSIKSFTSHEINKRRGQSGPFWTEESFDHVVRDFLWFTKFVDYICQNPVERQLVERCDEYAWLWVDGQEVRTARKEEPFGLEPPPKEHRRDACATSEDETIEVFTTRPDTLFGATYMVLAPEHPLVEEITTPEQKQSVAAYVEAARNKSELERTAESKQKTGVFTGAYAINPVNQQPIPIWAADYVMMGYGTGAIMAVPAHDTRDFEFAKAFSLPIVQVVQPPEGVDWQGYVGDGVAINSGRYEGMTTAEFKKQIVADLEEAGVGSAAVNYKLRDWLFSRQRYWGEPFPIVHCPTCGTVPLGEHELPLLLPEMENFSPEASEDPTAPPRPPLARAAEWVNTPCPICGGQAQRELNTMPQWAGSCWYFLRYLDARNDKEFVSRQAESYWMAPSEANPAGGVDLYVGGAEHAVLHLLYSRFWHKVLFDLGYVSRPEPFGKLFNQGMIRSFAYRDSRGVCVGYDKVDLSGDKPRHKDTGEVLTESIEKMSKSLKNVINPDEVISQYGADTFRLYEMFMGPLEASKPWNTRDVPGVHRFLHRVWRMIQGSEDSATLLSAEASEEVERALHKLIKKAGEDIEAMKFNTAISAMMEFVNAVFKAGKVSRGQAERFLLVLAPFAPHIAEELWQVLGHGQSLAAEPWPVFDEKLLVESTLELPVQVNGKVRGRITVPADAGQADVLAAAKADEKVAAALAGKKIVKEIVVPGRLVNLVVK